MCAIHTLTVPPALLALCNLHRICSNTAITLMIWKCLGSQLYDLSHLTFITPVKPPLSNQASFNCTRCYFHDFKNIFTV